MTGSYPILFPIEPFDFRIIEQLLAEVAFGGGKPIVQTVEICESEAPIKVVRLHRVRSPLEI